MRPPPFFIDGRFAVERRRRERRALLEDATLPILRVLSLRVDRFGVAPSKRGGVVWRFFRLRVARTRSETFLTARNERSAVVSANNFLGQFPLARSAVVSANNFLGQFPLARSAVVSANNFLGLFPLARSAIVSANNFLGLFPLERSAEFPQTIFWGCFRSNRRSTFPETTVLTPRLPNGASERPDFKRK